MFKNIIIILLTFSINYIIETKKSKKILNFSEKDFDEAILRNKNDKKKWLFILYSPKYNNHKDISNLIRKEILPFIEDDENIYFGLINLESPEVSWLEQRLSISYVPALLYIERGQMYPIKYPTEFNGDVILSFLDKEKKSEKFKLVPGKFTFNQKAKFIYENVMDYLNSYIQGFLDDRDINVVWTYKKTWFLFFCLVSVIFIIEYIILSYFFIWLTKKNYNHTLNKKDNAKKKKERKKQKDNINTTNEKESTKNKVKNE